MRYGGSPRLSIAQQFVNLRANPISSGAGTISQRRLTWRCLLSPTPLSRAYAIRIEYRLDRSPEVIVESPDLRLVAAGRRIPHVYSEDPMSLCLYRPKHGQWAPYMLLDRTVVPWAVIWLFYFEEWLRTGEWRGGGEHPDGSIDRNDDHLA
jgi:hypothetical protein